MSRLHELAVDLGVEVDEFASRIEEERRKINDLKTLFDNHLKGHLDKEEEEEVKAETSALQAKLERLQRDMFVSASAAATKTTEPHLAKALHEVRAAAQRIREKRMEVVGECKAKLDEGEVLCHRNCMLEAFINNWSKRLAEGKHLSELPEVIKQLSEEMARFYCTPVHHLLEEALAETPNTTSDSAMHVSKVDASATETSSGVVDGMMYNAATVDTSMPRVGSDSESSISHGADNEGKFSPLDCPDTLLSDGQGIKTEEEIHKLMQVGSDAAVHGDHAL